MLEKVITGGQTGAEEAAWRAARDFGVPTGGWMARGFASAREPSPERQGALETLDGDRSDCVERNVHEADATLWFGATTTADAQATVGACHRFGKPCMPVYPDAAFEPGHVAAWITAHQVRSLYVSGNREAAEPGISRVVEQFLGDVLLYLGHQRA
jgi:hypothetical protein